MRALLRPRPRHLVGMALILIAAAVVAGGGATFAAFSSTASNDGNSVSAASDFRAPTVSRSVIRKETAGTEGFLKQGATYRVYAQVDDTGNPASGISSVTANVSNVTSGQTAAALSSGSFTIGALTYNYRSAVLTAGNPLSEGSKSYTIAAADNASNSGTTNGFSVTIDNTQPTSADIQATNDSGGTVGKAEVGDKLTFTFSEPIEPGTILSGWTGTSTNVVVRIYNGGLLGLGDDEMEVYNSSNSTLLPLGVVDLNRSDYVGGLLGGTFTLGASGTNSTMVVSGNDVVVTLGTPSTSMLTAGGNATASWDPVTTPTDRASNNASGAVRNEQGAADKEF